MAEKLYGTNYKGNKKLIKRLKEIQKELEIIGNNLKESGKGEQIVQKEDKWITKDEEIKYDEATNLIMYLSFESSKSEEIYEFPGVAIGENGKKTFTFAVSKNVAKTLAENADFYEAAFKIKFPEQIYQLAMNNVIPGYNYPAPEPKLASETPEGYEARLADYYKSKGYELKYDPISKMREAYPHEKTRYSGGTPTMEQTPVSEYYLGAVKSNALPKEAKESKEPALKDGEKSKVTGVNKPLGNKIEKLVSSSKGLFSIKSKAGIRRTLLIAAGGAVAIYGVVQTPLFIPIAIGATLSGIGMTRAIKAYKKNLWPGTKAKIKGWVDKIKGKIGIKGKGKPEPTQPEPGKQPGQNPTPTPTPTQNPTPGQVPTPTPGQTQQPTPGNNQPGTTTPGQQNNPAHGGVQPPADNNQQGGTQQGGGQQSGQNGNGNQEPPQDTPDVLDIEGLEDLAEFLGQDMNNIKTTRSRITLLKDRLNTCKEEEREAIEEMIREENARLRKFCSNLLDAMVQYVNKNNKNVGGRSL